MYAQWPDDHEVATWYALSLLGTVRPTDKGFRRQALAASIAEKVFAENPKHPGAAHFIIHAFDDPDHAPLALTAARSYAGIAPAAAHALHMPSHIFVQRGMWEDVRKSNIVAYKSATELNARMKLAEGREDFHTLGWLEYANLMLGNIDEAKANVESAKQAADRNPTNAGIRNGYLGMRARLILETEKWEKIALDAPAAPAARRCTRGHAGHGEHGAAGEQHVDVHRGLQRGEAGRSRHRGARRSACCAAPGRRLEGGSNPYSGRVRSRSSRSRLPRSSAMRAGQKDEALKLAKEAMDIELALSAPSGPPDPIKPAPEFYGELLIEAGKHAEAVAALELSLQRTPNRTPSVKAMQRARASGTAMR